MISMEIVKLQAENGLRKLESSSFKVALLRPCMIYGLGNKGNLPRLAWFGYKDSNFPCLA